MSAGNEMFGINLTLMRTQSSSDQVQEWWTVTQNTSGKINVTKTDSKVEKGLDIYIFSDQVSPPSLGFLAGYGYVLNYKH